MPGGRIFTLAAAASLLELLPLVVAHGHDENGTDLGEMNAASVSATAAAHNAAEAVEALPSYFWHPEHAGLMYAHIALMILGWVVVLPVGCALSIARSRFTLPVQSIFLLVNAFGLLTGVIYKHQTPDLYPNSVHNKIGWAVTWIASAWVFMGVLGIYTRRDNNSGATSFGAQAVTAAATTRYERLQDDQEPAIYRWSGDSGQGTERDSASSCGSPRSPSVGSENQRIREPQHYDQHEDDDGADVEKRGFLRNTSVDRFLSRNVPRLAFGRILTAVRVLYAIIDRFMPILGFLAIATGAVIYGGIARGDRVFSVLAHIVKGGMFFCYGLLTYARWMGCFSDFGWAWNVKSPHVVGRWTIAVPSAEFTESFVIFLYGASNVFLEHLTAWGKAWSAQDLEHVSITIMFFGGGLLGMLIESRKIRDLLNTTIFMAQGQPWDMMRVEGWQPPKTYNFSLNPLPGLVVMLLGIMMSGHRQQSVVSTMMHRQWGTMFVGFALARGITYLILYLSPPTSFLPSRPPSEIVAAFCLVAGGLVFMGSSTDTVAALEANKLDAMFVFTVTMGFTALLMAWATVVVAIRGWAVRRENPRAFVLSHSAGPQA